MAAICFQQVQRLILAKKILWGWGYFKYTSDLQVWLKQQLLNEVYCNTRKPFHSLHVGAFYIVVRYMFNVVLCPPCFIISSQLSNRFTEVLCKSNSSSIGIEAFPCTVRVIRVVRSSLSFRSLSQWLGQLHRIVLPFSVPQTQPSLDVCSKKLFEFQRRLTFHYKRRGESFYTNISQWYGFEWYEKLYGAKLGSQRQMVVVRWLLFELHK